MTAIQCVSPVQLIVGCGDGTLATFSFEGNKFLMTKRIQLSGMVNSLDSNLQVRN